MRGVAVGDEVIGYTDNRASHADESPPFVCHIVSAITATTTAATPHSQDRERGELSPSELRRLDRNFASTARSCSSIVCDRPSERRISSMAASLTVVVPPGDTACATRVNRPIWTTENLLSFFSNGRFTLFTMRVQCRIR